MKNLDRLGRGCEQCPLEAVVGTYYQCKNPACKNYTPGGGYLDPLVGQRAKPLPPPRPPQQNAIFAKDVVLYGRFRDSAARFNRYKDARDLIGRSARKKLHQVGALVYAVSYCGPILAVPSGTPNEVIIQNVYGNIILSYLDWDPHSGQWIANKTPDQILVY